MEWLYGVATGWLGWTPDVAWSTPIPEIHVALRAKNEWHGMVPPEENHADKLKQKLRMIGK